MASVEESVELAIKTGLVTDGITATIRSFFLDDATSDTEEERIYESVGIMAHPNTPVGYRTVHKNVPVSIRCMTHFLDDKKRTNLADLYEAVRDSVDTYNFQTHMPTGLSMNLMVVEGGTSGGDGNEQYVQIECLAKVCGVEA